MKSFPLVLQRNLCLNHIQYCNAPWYPLCLCFLTVNHPWAELLSCSVFIDQQENFYNKLNLLQNNWSMVFADIETELIRVLKEVGKNSNTFLKIWLYRYHDQGHSQWRCGYAQGNEGWASQPFSSQGIQKIRVIFLTMISIANFFPSSVQNISAGWGEQTESRDI